MAGFEGQQFGTIEVSAEPVSIAHEIKRPFRTALMTGLGFAVAALVVVLVSFLLVLILVKASSSGAPAPVDTGGYTATCDDGSTPTLQDGSPICDDGSIPS